MQKESIKRNVKRDLAGKRFGRLTAIAPTDERFHNQTVWLCECDCGAMKTVPRGNLIMRITTSCGCYKRYRKLASNRAYCCNKTGFRGVSEVIRNGKNVGYVARFRGEYLGTFPTPREAQICYLNTKERYISQIEHDGGTFE